MAFVTIIHGNRRTSQFRVPSETDQDALKKLAINNPNGFERSYVLRHITSQRFLADRAIADPILDVALQAAVRVKSIKLNQEIAVKAQHPAVIWMATSKVRRALLASHRA